jgi:hypothetical protein
VNTDEGRAVATNVDFLKAKVQSIKTVLEKTSPKEREKKVTLHLAEQFNDILKEIGTAYPEAAPHLPKPIPVEGFSQFGLAAVGYVDLMIFAEQVLHVLALIESRG